MSRVEWSNAVPPAGAVHYNFHWQIGGFTTSLRDDNIDWLCIEEAGHRFLIECGHGWDDHLSIPGNDGEAIWGLLFCPGCLGKFLPETCKICGR